MCKSFLGDLLNGLHAFGTSVVRAGTTADTFNMALYLSTASPAITALTTAYSSSGEVANSGSYSAGGSAVTAFAPATSGTGVSTGNYGYWTPGGGTGGNISWTGMTASSFDTALLYNATASGKNAVAAFNFGVQSITAGTLTLTMPTNAGGTALINLGT